MPKNPLQKTSSGDPAPTHLRACCRNVIKVLEKIGVLTPELDARLLISDALDLPGAAYFIAPDRLLSEDELSEIAGRLARRMAGEPVSRIIGRRGFWKHDFHITPDVLDPRPDSETLIEAALEIYQKNNEMDVKILRILDLGTGSGALLISLLLEFPQATGIGVDISTNALEVARQNGDELGCADRALFYAGNWIDALSGDDGEAFDLIVSNPPYIPGAQIDGLARDVRDYDPHQALDGGVDGLDPYREIIPRLGKVLKPGGVVLFEIGEAQHEAVENLFQSANLHPVGTNGGRYKDLAGSIRCLAASPAKGLALSKKPE